MDEVEDWRRAGNLLQRKGVTPSRRFQVGRFHRHGVKLSVGQRDVLQQAFTNMSEVPIRVSREGHPLIYLDDMDALPGDILGGQGTEHEPRSVTAADGHDEAAARRHGRPGLYGDDRRASPGDRVGIGKNFNFHKSVSNADWGGHGSVQPAAVSSYGFQRSRQPP